MGISFEKIKPLAEDKRSGLYLALLIRHIADEEVGKVTGTQDQIKKPLVWIHIPEPMLKPKQFTGAEGFKGASPKARRILEHLIPAAENFLAMPHIMDNFETHAQRSAWAQKNIVEKDLGADALNFFKKNPLSINVLFSLQVGFEAIAREVADMDSGEARYVREVVERIGTEGGLYDLRQFSGDDSDKSVDDQNFKKYDRMAPDQKWQIAHSYEDVCRTFLKKIADTEAVTREGDA